jgi:hypothetical protein
MAPFYEKSFNHRDPKGYRGARRKSKITFNRDIQDNQDKNKTLGLFYKSMH